MLDGFLKVERILLLKSGIILYFTIKRYSRMKISMQEFTSMELIITFQRTLKECFWVKNFSFAALKSLVFGQFSELKMAHDYAFLTQTQYNFALTRV
jgi:hypothetical protein